DGAVLDLVVLQLPRPAGEVLAVEDVLEAVAAVLAQDSVGLLGGDLADEEVAPADLPAVGLQLDRAGAAEGELAVPVVLQPGVIDDELAVEVDRRPLADLKDTETIPLPER